MHIGQIFPRERMVPFGAALLAATVVGGITQAFINRDTPAVVARVSQPFVKAGAANSLHPFEAFFKNER